MQQTSSRKISTSATARQSRHGERLIGPIRRESLDNLVVFDEAQLRRILKNYVSYYDQLLTHLSLDKNAPDFRHPQKLGSIETVSFWMGCITNMSGLRFSAGTTDLLFFGR